MHRVFSNAALNPSTARWRVRRNSIERTDFNGNHRCMNKLIPPMKLSENEISSAEVFYTTATEAGWNFIRPWSNEYRSVRRTTVRFRMNKFPFGNEFGWRSNEIAVTKTARYICLYEVRQRRFRWLKLRTSLSAALPPYKGGKSRRGKLAAKKREGRTGSGSLSRKLEKSTSGHSGEPSKVASGSRLRNETGRNSFYLYIRILFSGWWGASDETLSTVSTFGSLAR